MLPVGRPVRVHDPDVNRVPFRWPLHLWFPAVLAPRNSRPVDSGPAPPLRLGA
ncbi:MAG: hypothetical protein ACRDL7_04300 [Gaiellaceae bacterium]